MGEFDDLYLESDTLLLADIFKNFRKISLKIYHLDSVKLLSAPALAWRAKKTEVKLELLTDIDMLIMVERGIKEGILNFFCKKTIFFLSLHFLNNARNEAKIFLMFFLTFMSVFSLII